MTDFLPESPDDRLIAEFPMTVELGKLREFARATGCTSGPIFDEETPVMHPTFLTTVVFWQPPDVRLPHEYLGFNEARILHGEQDYLFSDELVRAGDNLTVRIRLAPVVTKQGRRAGTMRIGTAITDFIASSGAVVAQARTTIIETEKAP